MDTVMLLLFIFWGALVVVWVCYLTTTNKTIKEQEHEIAVLNTEKKRLLAEMRKSYSKGYTDGMMNALHDLEVEK